MGEKVILALEDRAAVGKAVKKIRKQGYIPGVIYGDKIDSRPVMGKSGDIVKAYRNAGRRQPIEIQFNDGKKQLAMIKAIDLDPVKHALRHIDFHAIKQDEKVKTEIPIVIKDAGETPAEKAGLVILTATDKIEIEALPGDLPERLEVPGEKLAEIGDSLIISDIQIPNGVTILSDESQSIATVYEPSALQAANEASGGDAEAGDESEVPSEEGDSEGQEGEEEKKEDE